MQKLGSNMTKFVSLPLAGLGAVSVKTYADFEASMSKVQAITGSTGKEMQQLEKTARDLAKTSKYGASEVAEAYTYMGMAGWDTSQIMAGISPVLDLATASGENLSLVSDMVTDSLTGLGLSASDTSAFCDLLASTSTASNTNVALMAETFKYAAPVCGSLGISMEDLSLATGLMANAGIKGSQSGTALRAGLTRLVKPTSDATKSMTKYGISLQKNDDGTVNLGKTINHLRDKLGKLDPSLQATAISTIFGTEAMSGWSAIINATEGDFEKLTKATTNYTGRAKEMADVMGDNLKGDVQRLKSAFEEFCLVIGKQLVPIVTKVIEKATQLVEWFSNLDEGTQKTIVSTGMLVAALGPMLSIGGKLLSLLKPLSVATTALGTASTVAGTTGVATLGASLTGLFSAALPVIGVVAGVGVGAVALGKVLSESAVPEVDMFGDAWVDASGKIVEGRDKVNAVKVAISEQTKQNVEDILAFKNTGLQAIGDFYFGYKTLNEENYEPIKLHISEQEQAILKLIEDNNTQKLAKQQEYFGNLELANNEEWIKVQEQQLQKNEQEKTDLGNLMNEKQTIYQTALDQKRNITAEEGTRLQEIEQALAQLGIENATNNYDELAVLQQRHHELSETEFAQHTSDIIKKAEEKKVGQIGKANEEYDGVIKELSKMEREGIQISDELKKEVISKAEQRKNDDIKKANEEKQGVVDALKKQFPELDTIIDTGNGNILTKIQSWARKKLGEEKRTNEEIVSDGQKMLDNLQTAYETKGNSINTVWGDTMSDVKSNTDNAKPAMSGLGREVDNLGSKCDTNKSKVGGLGREINQLPGQKTVNIDINQRYKTFGNPQGSIGIGNKPGQMDKMLPTPQNPNPIYFAKGGIVDTATTFGFMGNRPMVMGEAGKEAIIPLEKLPQLMDKIMAKNGSGLQLNIENFNNNREQDVRDLVEEISYYLKNSRI